MACARPTGTKRAPLLAGEHRALFVGESHSLVPEGPLLRPAPVSSRSRLRP
jgi:hypothetical protein